MAFIARIVGFFVSAMGVALIFDGVIEALQTYGVTTWHIADSLSGLAARPPLGVMRTPRNWLS